VSDSACARACPADLRAPRSTLVPTDSEEARAHAPVRSASAVRSRAPSAALAAAHKRPAQVDSLEIKGDAPTTASTGTGTDGEPGRVLKNQFNFSDRASQTFNNPMRDREVFTEPMPTRDFKGTVSPASIFDAYLEQVKKTLAAKAAKESTKVRRRAGEPASERMRRRAGGWTALTWRPAGSAQGAAGG
jgi:hypothetical protein